MEPALQQPDHDAPPETTPESKRESKLADEESNETPKMTHDSMVTVRLSEPPALTLDTNVGPGDTMARPSTVRHSQIDIPDAVGSGRNTEEFASDPTTPLPLTDASRNLQDELGECEEPEQQEEDLERRPSSESEEVNWEELQKTEDEETRVDDSDNTTAMLLARLEQENDRLATNPKSVKVQAVEQLSSQRPRPPSMAQLRDMVTAPTPPALRYSMLPPPPMTDLEFYAALVKDYQQTAARLPTLLTNKIRKGIPPPLRGVVWQSMSGARDAVLEEQFERFSGESSPYEFIISKDLGRSFPGVDMFRDPEGDGQRMLGRVLRCFSLYDQKIGYCQGLAFLVGPLLMHMPDKQAFCVLVRLMDQYDIRTCFLPDLAGLHVGIYQFRELLRENLPMLSYHLDDLQVDPAYVSQWFLSFFAVTCPLPMLFRIYDVIFAEGAPETLMRVALSLMRKNQARLLACTELEDVMQLLLSRGLWDCYHYNADEFVQDFVSLSGVVSREKLLQLEQGYREGQIANASAVRTSEVTTAAARFLGRIWASSTIISPKPSTLSPGLSAPSRPLSMLRRSASKQSLASTLNSMEASSVSVLSSASTEATSLSRDSSNTDDNLSIRESTPVVGGNSKLNNGNSKNADERYLHSQIEDLLTALGELQRSHSLLATELQTEREQRKEDKLAVRSLLDGLRKKASTDTELTSNSESSIETVKATNDSGHSIDTKKEDTNGERENTAGGDENGEKLESPSADELSELLDVVEQRFGFKDDQRRSSMLQSKSQLRDELAQAKQQLANALSQSQDYSRRIYDLDQEVSSLKDQVKNNHTHVRTLHQDKQRLEKQIHGMRARASAMPAEAGLSNGDEWPSRTSSTSTAVGLRELKLGRSKSTPSQAGSFNKRTSSLPRPHESTIPTMYTNIQPASEHEALLLDLVQAKTAEAIARQDADEAKQKLEQLRRAYGLAPGETPPAAPTAASAAASAAMGVLGRITTSISESASKAAAPAATEGGSGTASGTPAATAAAAAAAGSFWGWRRG